MNELKFEDREDRSEIVLESDCKFGDKVKILSGKYSGSVGIVKKITVITQVQIDFIGARKTVPIENIEKSDQLPTTLLTTIESEFE